MANTDSSTDKKSFSGYQFGTFKGVFTPSILTILGVIMYLRFGWALGNVGLAKTLAIVTIASSITFLTGLSLSSLATNMKVKGGGAYFIISRSLGIEAGAAVGLPLFLAQALGIAFYIAGFSESLVTEFPELIPHLAAKAGFSESLVILCQNYDTQIVGVITLLALTVLAYKSADLALKSQFIIMAVIIVSLISFFFGGKPDAGLEISTGHVIARQSFWPVFAVIFPAVTGIEAGIAMSGDLKDPAKSLPRGTIGAVLLGYAVYVAIILFLWSAVANRDLLISHPMMMRFVARWGGPILLGVWSASLSSAMGALLGAPRTLQALARDRVIPGIFARGFGKGNDPRIATATAFLVGLAGVLLGNLNVIAPILSMFFLTSYGLLNISAGLEELAGPPSWRPKFRVHWIISLTGAFGCFAAMFMINAGATFIAAFVAIGVYAIMERRSLRARWGDIRSGVMMLVARYAILGLARRKPDERTWKPNILALSGSPASRWYLIELANAISHNRGFLTIAAIVPEDTNTERVKNITQTITEYLDKREVSSVVKVYPAESPLLGAQTLVQTYGYGPISPNTIMLGETEQAENYQPFAQLIKLVNFQKQNLVVMRESDEVKEFQEKNRIDVWWYGTQQNLGLMLALAHLLKQSPGWRSAELVLKSIIKEPEQRPETLERLEDFISKVRLTAKAEVLIEGTGGIFETMRTSSQGADLVLMGMRAPEQDEPVDKYSRYYESLLAHTEGLPPAALVLAAEEMDFYAIFQES
ncbi:Na-K-Cl cotransporter [Verrucomicrobiota bacterium]